MGARAESGLARDRLLAMHGCPTAQRTSAVGMGRLAYGIGLAGVSWAFALVEELERTNTEGLVVHQVPVWFASSVIHHAGPALLLVLPVVVACAVFAPEAPGRRHLAALLFVPLAFAAAFFVHFGLDDWSRYSINASYSYYPPPSLLSQLKSLALPVCIAAALAALPIAPILSFARAGASEDHDARARRRIGACLAVASAIQLAVILYFALQDFALQDRVGLLRWELLVGVPPLAVLVFGLVETVNSHRVLLSLGDWLTRVRVGEVRGVRVRAPEPADSALYVPDVVAPGRRDEVEMLEAYAECGDTGPYRMKRSSVPLGRVPRAD